MVARRAHISVRNRSGWRDLRQSYARDEGVHAIGQDVMSLCTC